MLGHSLLARAARCCTGIILAGALALTLGAQSAGAKPYHLLHGKGRAATPCGNPANHALSTHKIDTRRYAHKHLARLKPKVKRPADVRAGGQLRCFGVVVAYGHHRGPELATGPVGLGPSQIESAYKLTGLHSGGRRVAIVDAYNDPTAASDLNTFRTTYNLPACTTSNGCFKKVNQTGATTPLPRNDYGWSVEISLDLDAVSSACPDCHILLVEANSPSTSNLNAAEDAAATAHGVASVSNSWGGAEDSTILTSDSHFKHPGVAITASSGDNGYGVEWPASSRYVTAVGGTNLTTAANARGWTEKAWSDAGSGCSAYEPKPSWQTEAGCSNRLVADVSADADPASGLGIYDTANNCGSSATCKRLLELGLAPGADGWLQVGGTSLSSPLIASVYALAGNSGSITSASYAYSHTASLYDVTTGSNGTCTVSDQCNAEPGLDGPTGLGTPDGTGAF